MYYIVSSDYQHIWNRPCRCDWITLYKLHHFNHITFHYYYY